MMAVTHSALEWISSVHIGQPIDAGSPAPVWLGVGAARKAMTMAAGAKLWLDGEPVSCIDDLADAAWWLADDRPVRAWVARDKHGDAAAVRLIRVGFKTGKKPEHQ